MQRELNKIIVLSHGDAICIPSLTPYKRTGQNRVSPAIMELPLKDSQRDLEILGLSFRCRVWPLLYITTVLGSSYTLSDQTFMYNFVLMDGRVDI